MSKKAEMSMLDDVARLLGGVRDGRRYRLTVESSSGRRSGIVRAEVTAPRVEITPGHVTFVMEGETLNENNLYPGAVERIVSIEELE